MPQSKCSLMAAVMLLLRYKCVTPTGLKLLGGLAYDTAVVVLRVLWKAGLVEQKGGVWCLPNASKADMLRAIFMNCYGTEYIKGIHAFCSAMETAVGTVKLTLSKMRLPSRCSYLMRLVYNTVGRHVSLNELKELCEQLKSMPIHEHEFHKFIDAVKKLKMFNKEIHNTTHSDTPVAAAPSDDMDDFFDMLPGRF